MLMKVRNNEQGSTLLIVLMLIVVFSILGVGLLSMNISASKQFNKKEEQVQARHLAEMGLLHYKSEIKDQLTAYTFQKDDHETTEDALKRSQLELCEMLDLEIEYPLHNSKEYIAQAIPDGNCEKNSEGKMKLKLSSQGKSNETLKRITATATFIPPTVIEIDDIPAKPNIPGEPLPDLPDYSEGDVEVTGPIFTKKETQHFKGSLVINHAAKDPTFRVDGGNGYNLTVDKDFYIGGDLDSQNHACILVRGNLTIQGESYLGNKTVVIVYGNAYFKIKPELQNENAQIYVAGNTFLGSPAEKTTEYKSIPIFKECKEPYDFKEPYEPERALYQWKLEDELNPIYE